MLNIDSREFINEIFGVKSGDVKVKGLVDCSSSEEFDQEYNRLVVIWKSRNKGEEFIKYMDAYKKQKIRTTMLASTRMKCGLGNPPEDYTQNGNEAINSMIKRAKEKKKLSLKDTIKLIQHEQSRREGQVGSNRKGYGVCFYLSTSKFTIRQKMLAISWLFFANILLTKIKHDNSGRRLEMAFLFGMGC